MRFHSKIYHTQKTYFILWICKPEILGWAVATTIYITKACHMIKVNLLTSLLVEFCFIYYMASFSIDSVSEPKNAFPLCSTKVNYKNGPKVHGFTFPKSKHLINGNMPLKGRILPRPFSKVSS